MLRLSCAAVILLLLLPLVPESPRYLLVKGKTEQAQQVLRKVRQSTVGGGVIKVYKRRHHIRQRATLRAAVPLLNLKAVGCAGQQHSLPGADALTRS
jgi:uncharacterized membrane protein